MFADKITAEPSDSVAIKYTYDNENYNINSILKFTTFISVIKTTTLFHSKHKYSLNFVKYKFEESHITVPELTSVSIDWI